MIFTVSLLVRMCVNCDANSGCIKERHEYYIVKSLQLLLIFSTLICQLALGVLFWKKCTGCIFSLNDFQSGSIHYVQIDAPAICFHHNWMHIFCEPLQGCWNTSIVLNGLDCSTAATDPVENGGYAKTCGPGVNLLLVLLHLFGLEMFMGQWT